MIMSCSSASVGFWPRERITVPEPAVAHRAGRTVGASIITIPAIAMRSHTSNIIGNDLGNCLDLYISIAARLNNSGVCSAMEIYFRPLKGNSIEGPEDILNPNKGLRPSGVAGGLADRTLAQERVETWRGSALRVRNPIWGQLQGLSFYGSSEPSLESLV